MATSSAAISIAISSNNGRIKNDIAGEMRREYLQIINQKWSFEHKRNLLYTTIVQPVYKTLNLQATANKFRFEVIDKTNTTAKTIHANGRMIMTGRLKENDIVLCGNENEVSPVSRIQGYMFVVGEKIVFLDIWSFAGTVTVQRSDFTKRCVSTKPNARNILMFNKNEIIHLKMGDCIDVLIIPEHANKKQLELFPIYKYKQKIKNEELLAADEKKKDESENIEDVKQDLGNKKLNKKQKEFKDWICNELALEEYYKIFIENGFDDIEVVKLLNDNDLKEIGIDKKGSRMKILLYSKKGKKANNDQNEGIGDDSVEQNCTAIIGK